MNTWHINTKVIKSSSAGILVRRESGSKNKPRGIYPMGLLFIVSPPCVPYRQCGWYNIPLRYLRHIRRWTAWLRFLSPWCLRHCRFQDTPDRSVLYLDAILVGRDFDRRGIFLPRSKCLDSRFISLRVNRITCGECKCQSDDMYKLHLLVPKFVQM